MLVVTSSERRKGVGNEAPYVTLNASVRSSEGSVSQTYVRLCSLLFTKMSAPKRNGEEDDD